MNDIYDEVYTRIAKTLRAAYPGLFVTGDEESFPPAKLPCVVIAEADNYTPKDTIDSSLTEKYSNITWVLRVYASREAGKRRQAREIFRAADLLLYTEGFTRESSAPQNPLANGTVYWQAGRYVAATDGKYVYRR